MKKKIFKLTLALSVLVLGQDFSAKAFAWEISGNIVDVVNSEIFPGTLIIKNGKIRYIIRDKRPYNNYIVPGFIDAHVHVESSLLPPSEFARLAVAHGTVATISDPHEIANVLGLKGIKYMLDEDKKSPLKLYFGASSCVPATQFETAGAQVSAADIDKIFAQGKIKYLSEMMDYRGVINDSPEVFKKIMIAKKHKFPIDGHAPGVTGQDLKKYVQAGITTDHETYFFEEGLEEAGLDMNLLIREGSAAKNFNDLHPLIKKYPHLCMFCSDDKHPDDLVKGHINQLVKRALDLGYDLMDVLRCASYNPVKHYGLNVGLLQKGDPADFVVVDNLKDFNVLKTYIDGRLVAVKGKSLIKRKAASIVNNFSAGEKDIEEFSLKNKGGMINVIEAIDGELITKRSVAFANISNQKVVSEPSKDILKIVVVNRYEDAPVAIGFVKNFGLKKGAIASSFAHDSHNIVAVGVSDQDIMRAVNLVIRNRGGLSIAYDDYEDILVLPIAGLMSNQDGYKVAEKYAELTKQAKALGSTLKAPYMTLSFMALLVMPDIKLSDKGLFDSKNFKFMDVFVKID